MTIQYFHYTRIRNVKQPVRGTNGSAGIDFFIPNDAFPAGYETINPGSSVLIPSGIKACIPKDYALIAMNKSGIATKLGLTVGACVVDSDYQGEIHIHMINNMSHPVRLNNGDKIVQFLLIPVSHILPKEVSVDQLFANSTERGEAGFGSTGMK